MRHAESVYNEKGILQGQIDCCLSEAGEKETICKARYFDASRYDLCICSPLCRAVRTAEIMAPGLKRVLDDRLKERSLGDWEGTPVTDEKTFLIRVQGEVPPKGESEQEIRERVTAFLTETLERYPEKRILVVTHAGVIHTVREVLGLPKKPAENLCQQTIFLSSSSSQDSFCCRELDTIGDRRK